MKRSTKVRLSITLDLDEMLPIADLLGLDKDEEVPHPDDWKVDVAELVSSIATSDYEVTVQYANPAHDPDTIPMFAEHAPDPFITKEVA